MLADADKRGNSSYYNLLLKLVRVGGVIAVDNVLWYGRVAYDEVIPCIAGIFDLVVASSLPMISADKRRQSVSTIVPALTGVLHENTSSMG